MLVVASRVSYTFKGGNDWECEGWILKPPHFDSSRKYPLLLEIHGGPNTCYGHTFGFEFQLLAARGYVVVYTNPRGSTSYGREFSQAVRGIWGQEDYTDLMRGVDDVVARGAIDPDRMGVLGGSYGGFMTAWIVGHTDRFHAAIADRAYLNAASFYGTSDIGPWLSRENWEKPVWEDRARYEWHSPLTYVQNIHTPLLIIHSEKDYRCPIEQAEQLFTALIFLGRETEFLRFEEQNHDLSRNGHPRLRVERLEAIVDWFTRYLPADQAALEDEPNGFATVKEGEFTGVPRPVE
jgi:dipeptidyl aminopeptidase/acylaminoacyl peptidase